MDIQVITNSLPVAHELMGSSVKLNLVGGEIDKDRLAVHGRIAEEHIVRYQATKAFLGVDAISAEHGLSANSEHEAGITLAMAAHADVTYLLCDSSKIGRNKYLQFAPVTLVDFLISNKKTDALTKIEEKGIRILV
jgi:DeoR family fructose operon transcriptional repressor